MMTTDSQYKREERIGLEVKRNFKPYPALTQIDLVIVTGMTIYFIVQS
ncbi:hypothetical protein [Paenibacillus sp. DS2015]